MQMTTGNESGSYVISYMDIVLLNMNVLCSGDLRVGMVSGAVSMVTVSYLVISACAVSSGGTLAGLSSAMTQDNLIFIFSFPHTKLHVDIIYLARRGQRFITVCIFYKEHK